MEEIVEKIKGQGITLTIGTLLFIMGVVASGTKFYIHLDTLENRMDKRHERNTERIDELEEAVEVLEDNSKNCK